MKSKTTSTPAALPESFKGRRQLQQDDSFSFGCHTNLECFTRCCADVTIMLTPVDVLSLARGLGLTTTEFLPQHTITPISKEMQLPIVVLKMGEEDKRCPFVKDAGCSVYDHRPWSCRMYPVGMGLPPARAGEQPEPMYFLFEDGYCDGGGHGPEWTVQSWRENQGVEAREELEAGFREIVSHPWFIGGRQLDPKRMQMFHMAAYDLDSFRRFVFESSFLERFVLDDELVAQLQADDNAMLKFAFRWLRYALFGEPTMTPREKDAVSGSNP